MHDFIQRNWGWLATALSVLVLLMPFAAMAFLPSEVAVRWNGIGSDSKPTQGAQPAVVGLLLLGLLLLGTMATVAGNNGPDHRSTTPGAEERWLPAAVLALCAGVVSAQAVLLALSWGRSAWDEARPLTVEPILLVAGVVIATAWVARPRRAGS